ncbi:putative UDP-GlcNAc:betaGal beta-1,3-N-acetylglucosaminyltransferase LOC100288842 [Megalops cyprinoides]|uniref:putative UDP-GlcNAc:betaGal beta-1,3-N-acetylglucosaminyltransferase LOC100288842 n=1 Tax=Megalops cyprinoides TaxID=118141 RepID=UPI001863EE25|nr:putative UDP-GlcNAc:betaGal beta-1,3-N-acetylglucosaminyltransferase LOC100288842 [Megalops cyprinoides]
MQLSFCKLRTHQWCFLLFNVLLFHALLFGADFVEEYLLQPFPGTYTDVKVLEVRERARKLDLTMARANISRHYSISSAEACSGQDVFLLVLIFSAPEHTTRRELVRSTWANRTRVQGFAIQTLFVLGSPRSLSIQTAVLREAELHGDIIQGHTIESPANLTPKTILAMQWVVTYCPFARFILQANETAFVNTLALGEYLLTLRRHPEDLYLGRVVHQEAPNRDPSSPHFLSSSQYPDKYLPDYCMGSAFVLSQDVARKVYVASVELLAPLPYDVFTGLCARKAGVVPTHSARFSGGRHIRYNTCCYRFIFSSADVGEDQLPSIWQDLREGSSCTLLETYYGLVACKALTYLDKFSFFSTGSINDADSHG